jgi:hypothetical protein
MIINCTPHDVVIYSTADCYMRDRFLYLRDYEGEFPQSFITYPAAKEPARVTFVQKPAGMADGIPVCWWAPEEIVNLPEPKPDTYYIVSKMVAQACPEREDLILPGTLVRDADGHVIGCVDFSRV